jgi:hypothetical protein
MGAKQFKAQCVAIDEDVSFYDDARAADIYEDDGNLHVRRYGVRAAFDVGEGQSATGVKQNANATTILTALGLKFNPDRVMVEEYDEDENDRGCLSCGRSCECG